MSEQIGFLLALNEIIVSEQVRTTFDADALKGLAASIKQYGILQPLIVSQRGKAYHLVDGERRYRAAIMAGCVSVPVIVREMADNADKTVVQLVANLQRVDLNPIEKARTYAKLESEFGMTRAEIASRVHESEGTISRLIRNLDLSPELQAKIESGAIPSSIAYQLTHVEDETQRNSLAAEVIQGRLTRDELQRRRQQMKAKKVESDAHTNRATLPLDQHASVTVVASALDLERVRAVLESLIVRVRKAQGQGLSLSTFLKVLKEQAKLTRPAQNGGK